MPVPGVAAELLGEIGSRWCVIPCNTCSPYYYVPVYADQPAREMRMLLGCNGTEAPQWNPLLHEVTGAGAEPRRANFGIWVNPAMIGLGLNARAALLTNMQCFGPVIICEDPPVAAADSSRR